MKYLIIIAISSLTLFSCKTKPEFKPEAAKKEIIEVESITVSGKIEKQGITSYQYGTHVIKDNDTRYALSSKSINLDSFVGKTVTVVGEKIKGYPVSGGPIYLNVLKVK